MSAALLSHSDPTWRSNFYALWVIAKKNWRTYWRYPLNAVSSVLQPIIWLAPVYFMGKAFSINGEAIGFAGYAGTTDYMSFILIGSTISSFINAVFWGMGYSMKNDMDAGVLESNWLTPLPRPYLLIGATLSSLLITTITSMSMLLLAALIFGFNPAQGGFFPAILTAIPMLVGLYGFGFAFAAVVLVMRESNILVDVSSFLIQIFSGSDFPVTVLPRWLLPISLALPLTYGFDAVRGWLLQTPTLVPLRLELAILVAFMFVMIWFGLFVFRRLERHVRIIGTLGQH